MDTEMRYLVFCGWRPDPGRAGGWDDYLDRFSSEGAAVTAVHEIIANPYDVHGSPVWGQVVDLESGRARHFRAVPVPGSELPEVIEVLDEYWGPRLLTSG